MVTFWGKLSLFWERNRGKGQTNTPPKVSLANWALGNCASENFAHGKLVAGKLGPSSLYILYIGIGYIYKFYTLYWMCNARIILSQASLTFLVRIPRKALNLWVSNLRG